MNGLAHFEAERHQPERLRCSRPMYKSFSAKSDKSRRQARVGSARLPPWEPVEEGDEEEVEDEINDEHCAPEAPGKNVRTVRAPAGTVTSPKTASFQM